MKRGLDSWVCLLVVASVSCMRSADGAVFTVTSTSDSGGGSLRQAIVDANSSPGTNRIAFDLPGQGPHTIQLTSDLPYLNGPVVIDGRTQPGFSDKPVVEVSGSALEFGVGFTLSGNSVLQGLVINGFESFA